MAFYKILEDYMCFSRKYMQYEKVSSLSLGLLDKKFEVSEEAQKTLRRLNRDRVACQMKIGSLNLPSFAKCETCNGKCCTESADVYFTPIDFWLTKYSSLKSQSYSDNPQKLFVLTKRLKSLLSLFTPLLGVKRKSKSDLPEKRCEYLGENGCEISHFNRPIKCVIYTCPRLKKSMDEFTRMAYVYAIKELYSISVKTFDLIKKESGLASSYGRISLIFTF